LTHYRISDKFDFDSDVVLYHGDCADLLDSIALQMEKPFVQLIVTSPPYNVGKEYETRLALQDYIKRHSDVIRKCYGVLANTGSLCWEVGNYIENGEVLPIDILLWPYFYDELKLKLRNRIIWHVPHGLHCKNRFSGRYETILWFTKTDDYYFDLEPIRVPSLWPNKKYYKGPKKGQLSSNPNGKNPSDVWNITNVKFNHPEKTEHPCQFPEELIRRLVLSLTKPGDWVLDPYLGSGTTAAVCVELGRKVIGAELQEKYLKIARGRIKEKMDFLKKTERQKVLVTTV
jgi:adenine-specific DNA-methyltransferase